MTHFNWRRILVVLFDIAAILGAFTLAFMLRFDFHPGRVYIGQMLEAMPLVLVVYFSCNYIFGLYRGLYYFSSFSDLINITKATATAAVTCGAAILFYRQGMFPRSVLLLHPVLAFVGMGAVRFAIRLGKTYLLRPHLERGKRLRVLIVGAGEIGENVARQMLRAPETYEIVGFIDDDESKWELSVHGRPVLGGVSSLASILSAREPIDELVLAVGARRGEVLHAIVDAVRDRGRKPGIKIAPSLDESLRSPGENLSLRKVRPADLLNRKPVELDLERIASVLKGKTVLVTGAGGTIGSELCRQALRFEPARLILLECHATSLFYIEEELKRRSLGAEIVPILGDIRNAAQIRALFSLHKPEIVLHAAAHKHVSQLETNVAEGVANNILGTRLLAEAARESDAQAFLLVSTDKAVRPASVMGATKRVAEFIVRDLAQRSSTRFMAVRFGNVLGSSGSVLEIFQRQLSDGGPLTVTDSAATRFFMTVEEAVQLIMQALSMAKGGEIFVLKMGAPVRILDMAKNLVTLSGLEPGKDVEIRLIGLKPGEKVSEELMEEPDSFESSAHPNILIRKHGPLDVEGLAEKVAELERVRDSAAPAVLIEKLQEIVPSYRPIPRRRASDRSLPQAS